MKRHFSKGQTTNLTNPRVGDLVLIRKGLQGSASQFKGPYQVIKTAMPGVFKNLWYTGSNDTTEMASITNVFKYHPRRNYFA